MFKKQIHFIASKTAFVERFERTFLFLPSIVRARVIQSTGVIEKLEVFCNTW